MNGKLMLCYRHSDEFPEFCRNGNAGQPRQYQPQVIAVREVKEVIKTSETKETARFVGMPLSTFCYRLKANEKLKPEDKFD
jgi:hypothetical protein